MKKLRIALVGLGDIAKKAYLPIVANHSDISPILCTRNKDTLIELGEKYRITEIYDDTSALILSKPDAIMIHSATSSHYQIAKQSLLAGIATFIDKPISLSINECKELVLLAEKNNITFYVGFNRRFAPLIAPLANELPLHVIWKKNRVSLPATSREFIFNDFIHLVDGLRFLAKLPVQKMPKDLKVHAIKQDGLLIMVHIQFAHNGALFEGSMNRQAGVVAEQLDVYLNNEQYQVSSLTCGYHYKNGNSTPLSLGDWQSNLSKRGFNQMIEHWIAEIKSGKVNSNLTQDILASHKMCEAIVHNIEEIN